MNFDNSAVLRNAGFAGFQKMSNLMIRGCRDIPDRPGVYLVVRLTDDPPRFLLSNAGGKTVDETVAKPALESKWVRKAVVLYVGKAGGALQSATLRTRIRQLVRFGEKKADNHRGGSYIWQLANYRDLLLCYKVVEDREPAHVEAEMLHKFNRQYKKLPFANRRLPALPHTKGARLMYA